MKGNMGTLDRIIRGVVAAVIVVLYIMGVIPSPWNIVLLVVAAIFIFTGIAGFCPLYLPLKISTKK